MSPGNGGQYANNGEAPPKFESSPKISGLSPKIAYGPLNSGATRFNFSGPHIDA